jgi:hypothetical protein
MSQPTLALLGTSADPPTEGHRALLEGLAEHYGQVATWASDNPLKQHGAPLALRAQLLEALVQAIHDPRIQQVQALSSPEHSTPCSGPLNAGRPRIWCSWWGAIWRRRCRGGGERRSYFSAAAWRSSRGRASS